MWPKLRCYHLRKDDFYTALKEVLIGIGDQRETVLLGDFNARIRKKTNDKVVGQRLIHKYVPNITW